MTMNIFHKDEGSFVGRLQVKKAMHSTM